MKHTILLILLTLASAILTGCTHNNGDIGSLFGQWAVDRVTSGGETVESYPCDEVYWVFQTDIIAIQVRTPDHGDSDVYAGLWHRDGSVLTADFRQERPAGVPTGNFPAWMLLPPDSEIKFHIDSETSTTLTLSCTGTHGQSVSYQLRKLI